MIIIKYCTIILVIAGALTLLFSKKAGWLRPIIAILIGIALEIIF